MAPPKWLSLLLVLVAFATPAAAQEPPGGITITILHTNDIHGHLLPWRGWEGDLDGKTVGGLDRVASVARQVRSEVGKDKVLLLDAGDTFGDTMIADLTQGKAVVEAMNAIGYDAMVVGNHEPDFTVEVLRRRIREARFPVLAANIVESDTGKLFTKPYLLKDVAGVKVGVIGVAYPNTALTTAEKNVKGLKFLDAPKVTREYVQKLRAAGAKVVVVLSHYGLGADKQLAKAVPGIDLIVGGHSHNRMPIAEREGETLIVQAGAHASDVGRVDLQVLKGKVIGHRRTLVLLDNEKVPADPEVKRLIDAQVAPHREQMEEQIAEATTPIVRAQSLAGQDARKRDEESPADKLFADILREKLNTDIALLPGVGYGVALQTGAVRAGDLRNLIPHDSKVVTMTLTGKEIREILEQSLENTHTDDPQKKVGGIIQVSGIAFAYDLRRSHPGRLVEVKAGSVPLLDSREYTVATNTLLSQGGHRYKTFKQGRNKQEHDRQYDMIKRAFKERGLVLRPEEGRIKKIAAPLLEP